VPGAKKQIRRPCGTADQSRWVCAVSLDLTASIGSLPQEVGGHTRIFFDRNIAWLKKAFSGSSRMNAAEANAFAVHILAALDGGMILSKSLGKKKSLRAWPRY
jgi:TetR/AcrR family transcriptional regulator, transcriptional repressor for nem operon